MVKGLLWKGHVGLLGFSNHLKGIKSTSTSTQCFCEPMVHPCSHAHGSVCAKVCSCGVPEHFLLHFSQCLYEFPVFTLRCYSVRGMDSHRIFILDLDHCFRDFVTCLFLLLSPCPTYIFSMRNLTSDPSIAPPFPQAVPWLACARLCSAFLSLSICSAGTIWQLWADHEMLCSAQWGLRFRTSPAASWCCVALWISRSLLAARFPIHSQDDVSGTKPS